VPQAHFQLSPSEEFLSPKIWISWERDVRQTCLSSALVSHVSQFYSARVSQRSELSSTCLEISLVCGGIFQAIWLNDAHLCVDFDHVFETRDPSSGNGLD
jgi:hypothetical protein